VSVGGTLSADVSAEIPVRIIDFVSLDPPPGHVGASPIIEQQSQPLARSWSSNQLRSQASNLRLREGPLMNRMVSADSLRLEDLNGGRGPSRLGQAPALSRISSLSSIRTNELPRAQPVEEYEHEQHSPLPSSRPEELHPNAAQSNALVDRALSRQLHHQMSLNCISSAIASATARRQNPASLRSAASSADIHESWEQQEEEQDGREERYYGGGGEVGYANEVFGNGGMGIQLDDLDHVPDDAHYLDRRPSSTIGLPYDNNEDLYVESDDELDTLMQSRFSDDDEGQLEDEELPARPAALTSPVKVATRPRSSSLGRASSPIKAPVTREALRPSSPAKRSPDKQFAFATPSSPVKATPVESQGEMFPPPIRNARPLPVPPTTSSGPTSVLLSKQPSGSSLRRNPGIIRKAPSTRSLRSVASSVELSSTSRPISSARFPLPPSRSPSLASPKMSPILATVRTRSTLSPTTETIPSSPRRVVKTPSPALRATRSMADLHGSPNTSAATRCSSVLPSVKSKVAALETRQSALTRLATTSGRARVSSVQLARADSVMSTTSSVASTTASEASFTLDGLSRANSFASFKAPLLKRATYADAPPVPSLQHYQQR
jgi:hypothetical protein